MYKLYEELLELLDKKAFYFCNTNATSLPFFFDTHTGNKLKNNSTRYKK